MRSTPIVDWEYSGRTDLAVGTGATRSEKALTYAACALGVGAFALAGSLQVWDWPWWVYAVCGVVALDVVDGTVANATNSCKRFYRSPIRRTDSTTGKFLKTGVNFALLHVHPIVLGALVPGASVVTGTLWYIALVASVVAVHRTPSYLQRPVAFALIVLAFGTSTYVFPSAPGLEWLVPMMFLKLVYGHTVREEPYRPVTAVSRASSRP